eukprot:6308595-Amphidinium_carterae.1
MAGDRTPVCAQVKAAYSTVTVLHALVSLANLAVGLLFLFASPSAFLEALWLVVEADPHVSLYLS